MTLSRGEFVGNTIIQQTTGLGDVTSYSTGGVQQNTVVTWPNITAEPPFYEYHQMWATSGDVVAQSSPGPAAQDVRLLREQIRAEIVREMTPRDVADIPASPIGRPVRLRD